MAIEIKIELFGYGVESSEEKFDVWLSDREERLETLVNDGWEIKSSFGSTVSDGFLGLIILQRTISENLYYDKTKKRKRR